MCDMGYQTKTGIEVAATSMTVLVFLGLSVHDLGPTDVRQADMRPKHRLMPRLLGAGHNK